MTQSDPSVTKDGDGVRRIVTGHDAAGVSTVLSAGPPPVLTRPPSGGVTFAEIWATASAPAVLGAQEPDPTDGPVHLPPPPAGTRIRITDFEPGCLEDGRQSRWHRTETVDYGIMISGELVLLLEDQDVVLRPGDVVVQRGTNHAWANRGDEVARIAFVLIDAAFDPALAEQLGADAAAETAASRADTMQRTTPAGDRRVLGHT